MTDIFKTKKFEGWLQLNWRTGRMQIYKKEQKRKAGDSNLIWLNINIDVNMPVIKTKEIKGAIDIPETQVKVMLAESLLEEEDDK